MKFLFALVICQMEARRPFPPLSATHDLVNLDNIECLLYTGACTRELRPVCGSDGVTRPNPCLFLTAFCSDKSLKFDHMGPCTFTQPNIRKSGNSARAEKIKPTCRNRCPRNFKPVCGKDGTTYSNKCMLALKNCEEGTDIEIESNGQCPEITPKCSKFCSRIFKPVCGSDGNTYSNNCHLENEQCDDPTIIKKYNGVCH
jgi:hypothetical protein